MELVSAIGASVQSKASTQPKANQSPKSSGTNPLANIAALATGVAAGSVAGDWISEKVLGGQEPPNAYEFSASWQGVVDENGVVTGEYTESLEYGGSEDDGSDFDFDLGV
jgi:hypothetical protein